MKKIWKLSIVAALAAALLLPTRSFALTAEEFQAQRIQLLQQLVALLTQKLHALQSQRGRVLGAATSTVATPETIAPTTGGGGSRRSGGGRRNLVTIPDPLVLTMTASGTRFTVAANQGLLPESIAIAFTQDMSPSQITLQAPTNIQPNLAIDLVRQGDSRTYYADMRGRTAAGESFTGEFAIVFPSSMAGTNISFVTTYAGNGVTRQVVMRKLSSQNGNLVISANATNPPAGVIQTRPNDVSSEKKLLAFDIANTEEARALVASLVLDVQATSSAGTSVGTLVNRMALVADGRTYVGSATMAGFEFPDMGIGIDGNATTSFEVFASFAPNASGSIVVALNQAGVHARGIDTQASSTVSGAANGAEQQLLLTGLNVSTGSTSATSQTPGQVSSSTYGTYTINFSVKAVEDTIYIPATASTTASTTAGVTYAYGPTSPSVTTESAVLTSTADLSGGFYRVTSGSTKQFTLTVTLDPSTAGTFYVRLNAIRFNTSASTSGLTTYTAPSDEAAFRTSAIYIAN